MERIIWTDRVRNKEVLHTVKEKRINLHKMKGRTVNLSGHFLRRKGLSKTRCLRKDRRQDISDRKTRKKKYAATGCL